MELARVHDLRENKRHLPFSTANFGKDKQTPHAVFRRLEDQRDVRLLNREDIWTGEDLSNDPRQVLKLRFIPESSFSTNPSPYRPVWVLHPNAEQSRRSSPRRAIGEQSSASRWEAGSQDKPTAPRPIP